MNTRKLIEVLRHSLDPNQRVQAEEKLTQIQKDNGFAPLLLQVVMQNDVTMPVRQAGAVYLKNFISSGWQENEAGDSEPVKFSIHEQDKAAIRDLIVDAVVHAPDIIKVQLCVCFKTITKYDFPTHWPDVVNKIEVYLQTSDPGSWMGALLCLYNLIKNYENHSENERGPLIQAMNLLLPMMYNLILKLRDDQSAESVLIKKQILKCYYSWVKNTLNFGLMTGEVFTRWMDVLKFLLGQPVPEHTLAVDEDKRLELPWWKIKKWAIRTLIRLFERYGSPLHVAKEYLMFSTWYLNTFTASVLEVLITILELFHNDMYVSPKVLKGTLDYMNYCTKQTYSWRLLKPYMLDIIQDIIFPILFYTDSDDVLWNTDPHEYIKIKFEIFEGSVSLIASAQELLLSTCKRRNVMFLFTMEHCWHILKDRSGEFGPREKDGILHVMGILNKLIMEKKSSQGKISILLTQFVYPGIRSRLGHIRARACWVLQCFAGSRFRRHCFLVEAVNLTVNALLNDSELPVKVQAALAIKALLTSQERVHGYLLRHVQKVTKELLQITHYSTEQVLGQIIPSYTEQLISMAYEITDHLATTFRKVIETDVSQIEKGITAKGLLKLMHTVLNAMEDSPEIMAQIEKTVLRVVVHILHHNIIEYYEAAISLMSNLTAKVISEDMWNALERLYQVFQKNGYNYFTDMMPVLHNYITVDTNAFVSNVNHILAMYNMAEGVLNSEVKDESKVYAAKLLEVVVLQCSGKIDNCLESFVVLVFKRLSKNVVYLELRIMLLQVLIAIMYCNPHLLFDILNKLQGSIPNILIDQLFIEQWIRDTACFSGIHERKVGLLGICTLLDFGANRPNLDDVIPDLMPSCLLLFEGLKCVDAVDHSNSNNTNTSNVMVPVVSDDDSSSDEDAEDDEESTEEEDDNMRLLARLVTLSAPDNSGPSTNEVASGENSEDVLDDKVFNAVSCYKTPLDNEGSSIDIYIKFKRTFVAMQEREPALYDALMSTLDEQEHEILDAIFVLGEQRQAQQTRDSSEATGCCSRSLN